MAEGKPTQDQICVESARNQSGNDWNHQKNPNNLQNEAHKHRQEGWDNWSWDTNTQRQGKLRSTQKQALW